MIPLSKPQRAVLEAMKKGFAIIIDSRLTRLYLSSDYRHAVHRATYQVLLRNEYIKKSSAESYFVKSFIITDKGREAVLAGKQVI